MKSDFECRTCERAGEWVCEKCNAYVCRFCYEDHGDSGCPTHQETKE